jgi:uncharacterized protein (TIGR02186 family)
MMALVACMPLAHAQSAQSQLRPRAPIAAGLAEETVEVKVNYSGARIVLFAASPVQESEAVGFAVALIGPSRPYVVAQRTPDGERRFEFAAAPTVFAIGVEPQVAQTVSQDAMTEAGLNAAASAFPRADSLMSPDLETWRAALVDLKMEEGLYTLDATTIERLPGGLRRARINLPPNAPPGEYKVRAVVFSGGRSVGETTQTLTLERGGMDATLFDLSRSHGFIYGFLAVLVSVLVGAIAAWLGRR